MIHRPIRALLLVVVCAAAVGAAEEPEKPERARLTWDHEGYAKLRPAAAAAEKKGARLLVGLAGSPH